MTPADHADLSAQLARALGWRYVYPHSPETDAAWFRCDKDYIAVSEGPGPRGTMLRWRKFDYRAPSVALPVLEWLRTKHSATLGTDARSGRPYIALWERHNDGAPMADWRIEGDTLHEAIARAAIAVGGGK